MSNCGCGMDHSKLGHQLGHQAHQYAGLQPTQGYYGDGGLAGSPNNKSDTTDAPLPSEFDRAAGMATRANIDIEHRAAFMAGWLARAAAK